MSTTTTTSTPARFVPGDPYPFPWNGDLRPENTALVVIDMQTDFCGKGGYIDLMGARHFSLPRLHHTDRAVLARCAPADTTSCTRVRHRPDTADLPANKRLSGRAGRRGKDRHRRRRPLWPHLGPWRARLGDHP